MIQLAPDDEVSAFSFGQPSRGSTSRISCNPKLAMARAAVPMFSPSCGLTSTAMGAGPST
jgi:hypothetical protein